MKWHQKENNDMSEDEAEYYAVQERRYLIRKATDIFSESEMSYYRKSHERGNLT